jgi:hypothetical protein
LPTASRDGGSGGRTARVSSLVTKEFTLGKVEVGELIMSDTQGEKKFLFSTEGVDLSDDSAVEDFAHTVWEAFMNANGEENNDTAEEQ